MFGLDIKGGADIVSAIGKIADDLFTSDDERLSRAEIMERLRQQPALAQVRVNLQEAKHSSIFVAGWRPFIGWTCGAALAYHYIVRDMIAWGLTLQGIETAPPMLDMSDLLTVLLGLLGLGSLRTIEKIKGVSRE